MLRTFASSTRLCGTQFALPQTQYRSFGLLSRLFGKPKLETYEKSGRCVLLSKSEIDVEKETDSASINVQLAIENDYSPQYDPNNDLIIRQYGSCLTTQDFPGITLNTDKIEKDARKPIVGRAFAGVIEYIPPKVRNKLKARAKVTNSEVFVEGDRIWGTTRSAFGQQWADYTPINFDNIYSAPDNIALHYCGLFALTVKRLHQCMRQSKMLSFNDFNDKKILYIGSGKESMINISLPLMYQNNAKKIDILTSSDRHLNILKEHFDETIKEGVVNIADYHCNVDFNKLEESKIKTRKENRQKAKAKAKAKAVAKENESQENDDDDELTETENEEDDDSHIPFEFDTYDIVIDSMGRDLDEIHNHQKFAAAGGKFWAMNTPMADFVASNSPLAAAWKMQQWFRDSHSPDSKSKKVRVVLGSMPHRAGTALHDWAQDMRDVSAPIIIDKMYELEQVQHALNYVFDNDESILGENIGLIIKREDDFECPDHSVEWYPVYLDDISSYRQQKQDSDCNDNDNNEQESIQANVNNEENRNENTNANDNNEIKSKTEREENERAKEQQRIEKAKKKKANPFNKTINKQAKPA